jgi:hypothetical protein
MVDIKACPRCGSQRIYMGTLKGGVIYGLTSWKMQCRECGYQGQPLLFDTQEAYEKFKEGLASTGGAPVVSEEVEGEQPDARVAELLKDSEESKPAVERKEKSWRWEIAFAIIIGVIVTALEAPSFIREMQPGTAILYIFFYVIVTTVIALVILIVLEYFYRVLKRTSS